MIDIYLNLTHYCNVDCFRCYLSKEDRQRRDTMPKEYITKLLSSPLLKDGADVNISWLGGEVTTLPVKVLEQYRDIIKDLLPKSKQILITNCYSVTDKHLDFIKETFDTVETTYAEGGKTTLNGDTSAYKERFISTLGKYKKAGIDLFINVELNDFTLKSGYDWIFEITEKSGQTNWEFDISVQFDKVFELLAKGDTSFLNKHGYPASVPLTISYEQWSQYVLGLLRDHSQRCKDTGISIGFLASCVQKDFDAFFSTSDSGHIITMNVDGAIFGTPVYSGIEPLAFGHIKNDSLEDILSSSKRSGFIYSEAVERRMDAPCHSCRFHEECRTGFSSVPIEDGSKSCVGMYPVREYVADVYLPLLRNNPQMWQLENH